MPDDRAVYKICKNGSAIASRRLLNLIEGTGITLTVADDTVGKKVDVTIAASGSSGIPDPASKNSRDALIWNGSGWIASRVDWTELTGKPATFAPSAHTHAESEVTGLVADLAAKQPLDSDLTTIAALTATTDNFMVAAASAWGSRTPAQAKTALALVKGDVGLGSVDNTADTAKPVSTAQQTALDLKAPLASPALTGSPTAPTQAAGDNSTKIASTAYARAAAPNASYRTILDCTGSHTAAKVAGLYGMGQGDPIAVSGTGILYPLNVIYIAAADYPTVDGLAAKLRIRAQIYTNDVAPTGNFTFGLYPITRPATSGAAGVCIYTIGTLIVGSNGATFVTPAADGLLNAVGSDFALPADGHYIIAVLTTATVAASAHMHLSAQLQLRNA